MSSCGRRREATLETRSALPIPMKSATDRESGLLSIGSDDSRWRECEEKQCEKQRRDDEEEEEEEEVRGIRRSTAGSTSGETRIEAGELSVNELGPAVEDASSLATLSLNDSPSALDSTTGAVLHSGDMNSGLTDSTISASSAEKAVSPRTEKIRKFKEYLKQRKFDTIGDFFGYICNNNNNNTKSAQAEDQAVSLLQPSLAARAEDQAVSLLQPSLAARAEDQVVSLLQPSLDKAESQQVPEPDQGQPVLVPEEARLVESSKEESAHNAVKWMIEEVMVAFKKYRERKDDLKECDYKIDELCSQCLNLENYNHTSHHFNFTMKMKTAGSNDWKSVLYFAEVKEIFGRKIYFCCPLEPGENGQCYECKNQRIDDLKHPIIGSFERGNPDSVFPFTYDSSSSDDDVPKEIDKYDEAWRTRMRAAGLIFG